MKKMLFVLIATCCMLISAFSKGEAVNNNCGIVTEVNVLYGCQVGLHDSCPYKEVKVLFPGNNVEAFNYSNEEYDKKGAPKKGDQFCK